VITVCFRASPILIPKSLKTFALDLSWTLC